MRSVSCGFCGGAVEVTPESLRQHILVCQHCDTVQRLRDDGELVRGQIPEERVPPVDVLVKDQGERVEIEVPGAAGQVSLTRQDLERGGLFTAPIALGLLAFASSLLMTLVVWAVLALVAGFILAKMRPRLPPVRLAHGRLRSASGFEKPFATAEIRQLYATRTGLRMPNVPVVEAFHVWALLGDDRRRHVAGPVASAGHALWLEEWLENRLSVAQLPVAGEGVEAAAETPGAPAIEAPSVVTAEATVPVTPAAAPPPPPPQAAPDARCDSCGASLTLGPEALRQGWLRCAFCDGLTLVYPPGADRPVLGLGRPAAERRFEIVPGAGRLEVRPRSKPAHQVVRLVAALVLGPTALGAVAIATGFGVIVALEADVPAVAVPIVLGGLLTAALVVWVGLAAALGRVAMRLDPGGARAVLRPIPVPWWPGRERRDADEFERVRVHSYAGASQRGLLERASAQMSRSGEVSGPDFAASMLQSEAATLMRVELTSPGAPPLPLAVDIEHPTEAFEIAAAARDALQLSPRADSAPAAPRSG